MRKWSVDHVVETDVLVVGGGLTGLYAAIRARDEGARTLLVDKATVGRSGCTAFAGGDVSLVEPEDDMDALLERYILGGGQLVDTSWLAFMLEETRPRVLEMAEWGVPFEREADGSFLRKPGRGGGALSAICTGQDILSKCKKMARRRGTRFLNRVMVADILVDDGIARGALGFDVEQGETYLFKAGAVVTVAGPCSFKATYIGHRNVTGDGLAAAYRRGAEVMSMEFAVGHNTGPRNYDISGLARFVAMGGKFINARGEAFMPNYDPVLKDRANWGTLARAMATEVHEGRGPVYFDLTGMSDEDYALSRKIVEHTFITLERAGLDVRKQPIEWIPSFAGNRAGPAGLRIDRSFATTIPGLFTGGDTGAKPSYGAQAGYHGMNLAWCAISGHYAGIAAASFARDNGGGEVRPSTLADSLEWVMGPLDLARGPAPDDLILSVQEALFPYGVVILKHADRLERALAAIERARDEAARVRAEDPHELVKAQEGRNMVLLAEMIVRASLLRTESRGTHYREDYPQRDDTNWRQWIYIKDDGGRMHFWTEPVPEEG